MLAEFKIASKTLQSILEKGEHFKVAIKKLGEEKVDSKTIGSVASLVGCELRHNLLLQYLCREFDLKEYKYALLIALANHFFLKKYSDEEIVSNVKEALGDQYDKEIDSILNLNENALDLVNREFDSESLELISLRFNVPTYVLKMWFKHFGKSLTFKTLKRIIRPYDYYFALNTNKISEEEFLKNNKDFEKGPIEGLYRSLSKINVRKSDSYQNYEIYSIRPALKSILDKVDLSNVEEVALYSGDDDALIRDIYARSGQKFGIHVAVPLQDERPDILRLIRLEKAKNINYFEINDFENLKAHISNKQDVVIVYPASSSFDKISKYPDYLHHFKQDSLDALIRNQKEVLKGMANILSDEGKLLYIVDTLDRKESLSIINDFLTSHRDFRLVEQNQLFAFQSLSGSFYYAILERKHD